MLSKMKLFFCALMVFFLIGCGETEVEQTHFDHLARAEVYKEQGQFKAAFIEYKNAVQKSGGDAEVYIDYAEALIDLGQYPGALSILEQIPNKDALTGKAKNLYYVTLIRTYQGMGKYRTAKKLFDNIDMTLPEVKLLHADNLLGLHDFVPAEEAYKALLDLNDQNDAALYGMAVISARKSETDQSLSYLKKIALKDSFYLKGQLLKAGIEVGLQDLEAAEETLSAILPELPTTDIMVPLKASVLERLAYILTRQGRSTEAYIYTKILAEAFPGADEVKEKYLSAVQNVQSGELKAAKRTLLEVLEDYPGYKTAIQLLGIISYLEGDNASASKYLSESVDPEVANEITRHIYAATNLKMNDPKKVIEILEPNIENTNIPETLALYGLAAISDGQYLKGEASLLKAISLDGKNTRVRLALSDFYRDGPKANKDKEWQQLDAAFQVDSKDLNVLKGVLSFYLRNEGEDKATQFINDILKTQSKDYATNMVAGYFYSNRGNIERALKHFSVSSGAVKEGGEYLNALSAKGRAELFLKMNQAAKTTFHDLIHSFPDSELGYRGLLSVYLLDENESEGQKQLEYLAQQNVKLAPYIVLIRDAISKQDVSSAKTYIEKAEAISGENSEIDRLIDGVKYVEALVAMQNKDIDLARSKVAEVLINDPDNMRLLSFLVNLEIQAGRINEAEKVLGQIESINRNHFIVNLLRGDVSIAKNDYPQAKKYFMQGWRTEPTDALGEKVYRVLGVLQEKSAQNKFLADWLGKIPNSIAGNMFRSIGYQRQGQRIKAAEGYEKVLALQPNNVTALNNLGWIYFEKKDQRALEILERAVSLAPDNAAVLDSYGWALVDAGQVSNGIVYLEKAYSLAPDSKEIKDHLDIARAKK